MVMPERVYSPWDLRQQRHMRFVNTEKEMRNAIRAFAADPTAGPASTGNVVGGEIVIASAFSLSAPVVIPKECVGITIRSLGLLVLKPSVTISQVFLVNAPCVHIIGVCFRRKSAAIIADAFVEVGTDVSAGLGMLIEACDVQIDRFYIDDVGADRVKIVSNAQVAATGGPVLPVVKVSGDRVRVIGNTFEDGGADTVQIAAGGSACAVVGNYFDGGDYTSTASAGGNTLSANNAIGLITAHATDKTNGDNA